MEKYSSTQSRVTRRIVEMYPCWTTHRNGCCEHSSAETCSVTGKECEPVHSDTEATLSFCSHCVPCNKDYVTYDLCERFKPRTSKVKEPKQEEGKLCGFVKDR